MQISELIQQLQSIQEKNWDIQVVVQYRDDWWNYYWYDENLDMIIQDWKIIL